MEDRLLQFKDVHGVERLWVYRCAIVWVSMLLTYALTNMDQPVIRSLNGTTMVPNHG